MTFKAAQHNTSYPFGRKKIQKYFLFIRVYKLCSVKWNILVMHNICCIYVDESYQEIQRISKLYCFLFHQKAQIEFIIMIISTNQVNIFTFIFHCSRKGQILTNHTENLRVFSLISLEKNSSFSILMFNKPEFNHMNFTNFQFDKMSIHCYNILVNSDFSNFRQGRITLLSILFIFNQLILNL